MSLFITLTEIISHSSNALRKISRPSEIKYTYGSTYCQIYPNLTLRIQ